MFPVRLRSPAPILQRYVQFYTQREMSLRDPLVVQSVPARAAPMFEFVFGDRLRVRYPGTSGEETSPRAVVVGMLTRPHAQLILQGTFESFVIMFQPTGLGYLFPVALSELTDHDYDAHSVIGRSVAELEQRLGDCESFAPRVKVADAFLTRRVPDVPTVDRISIAMSEILLKHGRVRIPELASYAGMGKRQFERDFGLRVGIRPSCIPGLSDFRRRSTAKRGLQQNRGLMSRTSSTITTRCT